MAERRMSREDQNKYISDKMAELRERGIADAQTFHSLHPEGPVAAMKEMLKDPAATRDQSQAQRERGKDAAKARGRDAKAYAEMNKDRRRKG